MKGVKDEIQNRRDFFKNAGKSLLPILGVVVFGPSTLSSCDKDDDIYENGNGGGGGTSGCSNCSGHCGVNCTTLCRAASTYVPTSCKGSCKSACYSCKSLCWGNAK